MHFNSFGINYFSFWSLCFIFSCSEISLEALQTRNELFQNENTTSTLIDSIQNSTSPEELVFALFDFLDHCKINHISIPDFRDGFVNLEIKLNDSNLELTPNGLDYLKSFVYQLYYEKNNVYRIWRNFDPVKPTQKQPEFKQETVFGCLQCFAGILLYIIPHPLTQAIGSSLIASGMVTLGYSTLVDTNANNNLGATDNDLVRRKVLHTLSATPVPYGWSNEKGRR